MRPLLEGRAARALVGLSVAVGGVGTVGVASGLAAPGQPKVRRVHGGRRPVHRPIRRGETLTEIGASVERADVLVGSDITVHGRLIHARRRSLGLVVEELRSHRWVPVAHGHAFSDGRFRVRFWPRSLGSFPVRVQEARSHAAGPRQMVTVFHRVVASWYGPGGTTACGDVLTAATLGVANRTLPCGTPVTLRLGTRTVRVPVIDRGPFVAGRTYDLTYATKLALGAGDVTELWASR